MVHSQKPVSITVEGEANVGVGVDYCLRKRLWVRGAARFVDIAAIGLVAHWGDLGAKISQRRSHNMTRCTMRTVDNHMDTGQVDIDRASNGLHPTADFGLNRRNRLGRLNDGK